MQRQRGLPAVALGLQVGVLGVVVLGFGDQLAVEQTLLAFEVLLLQFAVDLGGAQRLLGHRLLGLQRRGVELGYELPLLHLGVEVDVYFGYDARHLRTHVHFVQRVDRARRRDRHGYGVARDGLRLVLHRGILAAAAEKYRRGYDRHDRHGY